MWEVLVRTPLGRLSRRKFVMLLATLLVVTFGYTFVASPTVNALEGTWQDGKLIYNDHTYEGPNTPTTSDGLNLSDDSAYYTFTSVANRSQTPRNVWVIYFAPGTSPPEATSATLARYSFDGTRYSDKTNQETITLTPSTDAVDITPEGDDGIGETGCAVEGVGWIVCSVSRFLAGAMDYMYDIIAEFLEVKPLQTTTNNPLYELWGVARNIANIMFVIGFLIVIYAQISGAMLTNYTIKKMLPRVIIAAILVNISYWICALAVDLSNVLGYSVQELFVSIRQSTIEAGNFNLTWGNLTETIITGGTAALSVGVVGGAALVATGGSIVSAIFLLLPILVGVILAALIAIVILAMRQALITILIIAAPLAFVAYMLPNTEKWFEKWKDIFTTMLIMFPIFSVIFGGSQLAGMAIIQASGGAITLVILGMATQVAPFVITPLIVKFSGSFLARFANMLNNPNKGLIDRTRNWAKPRADLHAAKNLARDNKGFHAIGAGRVARRMKRGEMVREKRKATYDKQIENAAHSYHNGRTSKQYGTWDQQYRKAEEVHNKIEAHHKSDFEKKFDTASKSFDAELFDTRATANRYSQEAKLAEARYNNTIRELEAGKGVEVLAGITNKAEAAKLGKEFIDAEGKKQVAGKLGDFSVALQNLDRNLVVEGERKVSADVVIKDQIATNFKKDDIKINGINIREYAGGIAGEAGANRVYANARAEINSAYMKEVENSRSVLTEYSIKELVRLHQTGVDRNGNTVDSSNTALIDAAMQEIMLAKGNNWSAQKTKDFIAQQGLDYDEDTNEYYEVQRDASGNVLRDTNNKIMRGTKVTNQDEIDRRRSVQQLFVDAYNKSGLKVKSTSGTDRGNLETGTFFLSGQDAIMRDINDKKINATRLVDTDIDELMRTVQILRDDSARGGLKDSAKEALAKTIDFALTDDQTRASIGTREAEVMGVIQGYLNAPRGPISLAEKQRIEALAETKVPSVYRSDRLSDFADGTGPR